jgi:glycerol-3-phosphate dehydrogenase
LKTAQRFLAKKPTRADVLSVLLDSDLQHQKRRKSTKEVSRSHKIIVSETGLITITGGNGLTEKLPKTLLTKQSQFVIYLKKNVKQNIYPFTET